MERSAKAKERLLAVWSDSGVRIVFRPCPYTVSSTAKEATERDRQGLVQLSKNCWLPEGSAGDSV